MERGDTVGIIDKLAFILVSELVAICLIVTYRWIDLQSVATLLIFDFLFITLFTQLKGGKLAKISLIVAGNFLGMVWNYFFHLLIVQVAAAQVVQPIWLSAFYTVAYPFLNIFWVIAFWSFSLTKLAPIKAAGGVVKSGY